MLKNIFSSTFQRICGAISVTDKAAIVERVVLWLLLFLGYNLSLTLLL